MYAHSHQVSDVRCRGCFSIRFHSSNLPIRQNATIACLLGGVFYVVMQILAM